MDSETQAERRTAIIARELKRNSIDIAALSETRFSDNTTLVEEGAGYTFFCIGHPAGTARQAGVGFAIRSSLANNIAPPKGISPRLMTMVLPLEGQEATLVSAYAPTMTATEEDKEEFYELLNRTLSAVPHKHKLFLLGDFNARIGKNS